MRRERAPGAALLVAVLGAAACRSAPTAPPAPAPAGEPRVVRSNVERGDYAGSAACAACHEKIYDKWAASPMRRMTRRDALGAGTGAGTRAGIRAPFDGSVFRFKGDSITLEQHEDRRYMRVDSRAAGAQLFRVTKVIGGRYREDFVGREVSGTAADSGALGDPREEPVLPISYLVFAGTWRYKGYSVMIKERPHFGKHGAPWRKTCIFCHNTVPYLETIYDDLGGGKGSYQGSVSDRFLPPDRLWKAEVADAPGLGRALARELAPLGAPAPRAGEPVSETLAAAVVLTNDRFDESHLVEVGIGCEACHNGAREHVDDPARLPSFEPRSPFLAASTPSPARKGAPGKAEWVNHACARCHTVLFSRYPYTWEGGTRKHGAGGSTINSGEARDFLLGGCTSKMSCAACHDPHTEDSRAALDALGTVAGNRVCLDCHGGYRDPAALAKHTHHATDRDGSACLGCHMPRKNTGLGYRLTRYHRIGSPTDAARVEKDRPLECALCHADKPLSSLVETMEKWWGKSYDRAALRSLYGDGLGTNPLLETLARGKPHEQIAAAGVIGERGARGAAASLAPLLSSEYPQVRYYARQAIEDLLGQPMPVDLDGETAAIQGAAWVAGVLAGPAKK
jgi:predicted CXXCH cytochrome family protein